MCIKTKRLIVLLTLSLFSCSTSIVEENNGFIVDISKEEILFYPTGGKCNYSIDNSNIENSICQYKINNDYDIHINDYVDIIVDNKGNIQTINEAKNLYQQKLQLKDLLSEFESIEIDCEGYGKKIEIELFGDDLNNFIEDVGDVTVYKDFYKQNGAGGIGCKLTCESNTITTIIKDEGLTMIIDDEEYGYYFNSQETISSKIMEHAE